MSLLVTCVRIAWLNKSNKFHACSSEIQECCCRYGVRNSWSLWQHWAARHHLPARSGALERWKRRPRPSPASAFFDWQPNCPFTGRDTTARRPPISVEVGGTDPPKWSRFTSAPAAPYVVTLRAGCCSPLRRDAARRGLSSSLTHSDVTPSIELQFPGCAAMRCGPQLRTSVGKVIYWRAGEALSTVEQGFKKRARTAVRLHARPPQRYRIVCACGGFLIKTKVSKTLVIRGFCAAGLNSELLLQECPCVHTNTHTHTRLAVSFTVNT